MKKAPFKKLFQIKIFKFQIRRSRWRPFSWEYKTSQQRSWIWWRQKVSICNIHIFCKKNFNIKIRIKLYKFLRVLGKHLAAFCGRTKKVVGLEILTMYYYAKTPVKAKHPKQRILCSVEVNTCRFRLSVFMKEFTRCFRTNNWQNRVPKISCLKQIKTFRDLIFIFPE